MYVRPASVLVDEYDQFGSDTVTVVIGSYSEPRATPDFPPVNPNSPAANAPPPPLNQKVPISPVQADNIQKMNKTPGQNPEPKEPKPETTAPTLTGIKKPEPAPETKPQQSTKPSSTASSEPYFSEIQAPFTQITRPTEPGPASG